MTRIFVSIDVYIGSQLVTCSVSEHQSHEMRRCSNALSAEQKGKHCLLPNAGHSVIFLFRLTDSSFQLLLVYKSKSRPSKTVSAMRNAFGISCSFSFAARFAVKTDEKEEKPTKITTQYTIAMADNHASTGRKWSPCVGFVDAPKEGRRKPAWPSDS